MFVLGAAPAICKAENLMKIWVPPQELNPVLPSIGYIGDLDICSMYMYEVRSFSRAQPTTKGGEMSKELPTHGGQFGFKPDLSQWLNNQDYLRQKDNLIFTHSLYK